MLTSLLTRYWSIQDGDGDGGPHSWSQHNCNPIRLSGQVLDAGLQTFCKISLIFLQDWLAGGVCCCYVADCSTLYLGDVLRQVKLLIKITELRQHQTRTGWCQNVWSLLFCWAEQRDEASKGEARLCFWLLIDTHFIHLICTSQHNTSSPSHVVKILLVWSCKRKTGYHAILISQPILKRISTCQIW